MALTTKPHPMLKLKKEYSYTSTPPLCLHGRLQGEHYLYYWLPATSNLMYVNSHSKQWTVAMHYLMGYCFCW